MSAKSPDPVDAHVGARLRLRRNMLGMSQEKLGEALGITFQQIQKYEKGTNRVSASRLQKAAEILGVPVYFFFEQEPGKPVDSPSIGVSLAGEPGQSKEAFELLRHFQRIPDEKVRRTLLSLIKAMAGPVEEASVPKPAFSASVNLRN